MILCAHRGLSHACPENTLPAFGAAIALGVAEIEFDLWLSRDGVPVVCHDKTLDRTTDGQGLIGETAWADIQKLDAGIYIDELWHNVRVPKLEDILELAGKSIGINIHIKDPGPEGSLVKMVCKEIQQRKLIQTAYIAGDASILTVARETAPEVKRCCLAGQTHLITKLTWPSNMIANASNLNAMCQTMPFSVPKTMTSYATSFGPMNPRMPLNMSHVVLTLYSQIELIFY